MTRSLETMQSTVVRFLLLFVLIAIASIAVDGGNTSSVSKKIPTKVYDRTIICNVVQNSNSNEDIKSLEATLVARLEKIENKFEQLMAAINKTFPGSSTGNVSLMLLIVSVFVFFLLASLCFVSLCFWTGKSFASCKDIYENHK